ncbi:MAG: hypothetical protein ABIH71_05885 [Candidatus Omnitrophota bacterium]
MKVNVLAVIVFIMMAFCGCSAPLADFYYLPEIKLKNRFKEDFKDFSLPEINEIKLNENKKIFPYAEFNRVWEAVSVVMMQEGVLMYSSKDKGLLAVAVSPPVVFFIERNKPINVYLYYMVNLYNYGNDEKGKFSLSRENFKDAVGKDVDCEAAMSNNIFDKISTQIYANQKWRYLN